MFFCRTYTETSYFISDIFILYLRYPNVLGSFIPAPRVNDINGTNNLLASNEKKGDSWFHKMKFLKYSIYFGQLVHSQEYRLILENELAVPIIFSILKSYVISFYKTTKRYPALLL